MSYAENNLLPDEDILCRAEIHWFVYVPAVICFWLAYVVRESGSGGVTLFIALGIYLLVRALLYVSSTEFIVTNMRILVKKGWIRHESIELRHEKVESLNLQQGVIGRLLNFGALCLNGTGGGKTPIKNIKDPLVFRKEAMEAIGQKT